MTPEVEAALKWAEGAIVDIDQVPFDVVRFERNQAKVLAAALRESMKDAADCCGAEMREKLEAAESKVEMLKRDNKAKRDNVGRFVNKIRAAEQRAEETRANLTNDALAWRRNCEKAESSFAQAKEKVNLLEAANDIADGMIDGLEKSLALSIEREGRLREDYDELRRAVHSWMGDHPCCDEHVREFSSVVGSPEEDFKPLSPRPSEETKR